jgi:OOP family OmpA-OmpF porin
MRNGSVTAIGLVGVLALSGCAAMQDRRWGTCALAGGLAGAAIGGGTGAGLAAGYEKHGRNDNDTVDTIGIGLGSAAGGALLGTLLGHMICDPREEAPPPPPPPPPAPKKAEPLVTLHGAQFDFNKATLKPEGKAQLDKGIAVLKQKPNLRVSVEGHTDSIGSDVYNQKLSERRANAVRDYMVSQGIDSSRITTRGYGETRPIADNKTEEGRAENRRVEVIPQ